MFIALLNVILRALSLVGRFLLTLFLAKQAGFEVLGAFGIVSAIVAMAPAFLSFGIHYSMNRDLIGLSSRQALNLVRDRIYLHFLFFLLLGFLFLIGGYFFGWKIYSNFLFLGYEKIFFVIILIFLEVIGNEIHLALVNRRRSNFASVVQFVRNAAWIFPFMLYSISYDLDILLSILIFWSISSAVSLIFIVVRYRESISIDFLFKNPDFRYFLRKIETSAYIYVSDMANVGFQYGDRFILNAMLGAKTTGLYIFFSSIAAGVQQLVAAGFVQPALPILVDGVRLHGRHSIEYKHLRNNFIKKIFISSGFFAFVSALFIFFLGNFINRAEVREHMLFGVFVLFSVVVKCVYDAFGYSLYSAGFDRELATSNFLLALSSLAFNFFLTQIFGATGVVLVLYCVPLIFIIYRFKLFNFDCESSKS